MWLMRDKAASPMSYDLSQDLLSRLATYNSEVYRGIVHTDAYDQEMADAQRTFDDATRRKLGIA